MIEYKISDVRSLIIIEEVYSNFLSFVQEGNSNERGGILLGKMTIDSRYVYITDFSTPTIADSSGRFFFIRKKNPAQRYIDKLWRESKGEINYLGEWHTHPATNLTPSTEDENMISESLRLNDCPYNELYLVILGIDGSFYVGHMSKYGLVKLERRS